MKVRVVALAASAMLVLTFIVSHPAAAQFPGRPGRFVSTADGLTTVARDGSHPRILKLGPALKNAGVEYPSYTPRGRSIVFDASRDADPDYEIYRVSARGGKAVQLTLNDRTDWGPDQGPDRIAYVCVRGGDDEICTMRLDGSSVRQITSNDANDWNPKWTPDGSRIVFSSDRRGTMDIFSMRPDGTGTRRLTDDPGDELEPDMSPSGKRIVFWSNLVAPGSLVVMRADGTHQNILAVATPYPGEPRTPVWSPNGTRIAFGTTDQIWTRTPTDDLGAIKVVVASGAGNNIGWQPLP